MERGREGVRSWRRAKNGVSARAGSAGAGAERELSAGRKGAPRGWGGG
jgi:hypothetical protein